MPIRIKKLSHKLTIINPRVNYFEAICLIQTKKRSAIAFDKDLFILSHNPKGTENHIAIIFNPFMPGGNKMAYIRSKSLENMGLWN